MVIKIGEMSCLFCDSPICFIDGDMVNFQTHLEYEHEVKVAKQELVLAMSLLSEKEVKELIKKMKPRTEYFIEHGEHLLNCDIFDGKVSVEASTHVKELQINQIQQLLNDEFSDSENESGEGKEEEVQIEPTPARKVEEITLDVADGEYEPVGENIKKEVVVSNINTEEESVEKLLQEDVYPGASLEGESSLKRGFCGKSEFKKKGRISIKTCNILMKKCVTEYQRDEVNNIGDENLSPQLGRKAMKRKYDIMIKPCNIMIKKWVGESQPYDEDQMSKNGFNILEDEDLDSQQQQMLQNVTCKMEIGENEVDEAPEEDSISASEINNINLVEKLTSLNHCRLCFSSFSNKGNLKKHEETVHEDDTEALNLSFFTLKDLVYHCNMCPQIPGFLTENILNTHKRLQHRVNVKNTVAKCEICLKVVKYHGLKAHMLTHTVQEKKHECNLCYKKFLKLRYLQKHQHSIHSSETEYINKHLTEADLKFKCEVCNLKFLTASILKYHSKCHEKRASVDGSDKKFRCKLCYSGFSELRGLHAHQKIHREDQEAFERTLEDGDLKSTCSECDQRFVSNDVLKYHINKNHKELEFEELRKTSKEDGMYKCKLCYTTYKHFTTLNSHIVQNHQQDKALLQIVIADADLKHPCDECELRFVTGTVLVYHKNRVHTKKERLSNFNCQYCPREFSKFRAYKKHVAEIHKKRLPVDKSEKKYGCKLCYRGFKFSKSLRDHVEKIHKEDFEKLEKPITCEDLKFDCDRCDLKFISAKILEYHIEFGHIRNGQEKECKLCFRTFTKRTYLINHQNNVHKNETEYLHRKLTASDLKYSCNLCDKKFVNEKLLLSHFKKHETQKFEYLRTEAYNESEKRFKCKLCHTKYKFFSNLKAHLNSVHKEEESFLNREISDSELKFRCNECDERFISTKLVTYHILNTHDKDKDNQCKLCYKMLTTRSHLTQHQNKVHKNDSDFFGKELTEADLKYSCKQCEKKFVSQGILKSHVRKHQNQGLEHSRRLRAQKYEYLGKEAFIEAENVFRCKLCYTEYKYLRELLSHTSSVHAEDEEMLQRKIKDDELVHCCSECDKRFVTETLLDYHGSKCHFDQSTKHCKLCDLDFKTNVGFLQHKYKVHILELAAFKRNYEEKDQTFGCNKCNNKFVTEISRNHHISRKHFQTKKKSSTGKKFKVKVENLEKYCQLCYIMYKEPKYLRLHKHKVHADEMDAFNKDLSSDDMNHECIKCHKSFYSLNTLNYHMQRKHKTHSGSSNFECKLCRISFTFNSNLKKHLRAVHKNDAHLLEGDLDEIHGCNLCDKKFVADHILKYHMKYQHKEKDKHTYCKLCYVDFKHSSHLKAHKGNVHTSKEEIEAFEVKMERSSLPYQCKFCTERFLTENILRYHNLYSHKEERRQDMSCEFCNKVFKWSHGRKKVVKNHMKNLHNLDDYTVDEQEPAQKENDTVKNFMLLLNSLN